MPWGINNTNGQRGGNSEQPQAGQYAQRRQFPYAAPLFGSNSFNMRQQANQNMRQHTGFNTRQAGQYMPQQTADFNTRRQAGSNLPQLPAQLPDGVQIKPFNSAAMDLLQGMNRRQPLQRAETAQNTEQAHQAEPVQNTKQAHQAEPAQNPESVHQEEPVRQIEAARHEERMPAERTNGALRGALRELIQDERNSSRFYAYMAENAPRDVYADYFRRESDSCGERMNKLKELYSKDAAEDFSPLESEINTGVGFNTGVSWAVAVESQALKKFGALYENAPDEKSARAVFTHVCEKITHMMMLILIMENKELFE